MSGHSNSLLITIWKKLCGHDLGKNGGSEPMLGKIIELIVYAIGFLIFETLWYAIDNIRTDWLRREIYVAVTTILLVIWLVS